MTTRYLTIRQVADLLNVCENTVRRMLPLLGAVDLSGGGKRLIRIPETALASYLHGQTILPPVAKGQKRTEFKLERRRA